MPKLSVIIAAYNAQQTLPLCLERVLQSHLTDGLSYEIIVVDDGSRDKTAETARQFPVELILLGRNRGSAYARNQGASKATGDIFVFVDSDIVIEKDTLQKLGDRLMNDQIDAVTAIYATTPSAANLPTEYKNLYCHYVNKNSHGIVSQFSTCCGAVKKIAFQKINGFDEQYSCANLEDVDLGYRLTSAGYRCFLDKTIKVRHLKTFTLWSLIKNDFARAREWTALLLKEKLIRQQPLLKNESNLSPKEFLSYLCMFALILSTFMSLFFPAAVVALVFALTVFGIINASFFAFLKNHSAKNPFVFLLIYGCCVLVSIAGSGVGMLNFFTRGFHD